ncbi:cytochrome P450 [Jackrogersella minutella]|nr:cytochrome P450 [Jackrogersella minutella]
MPSTGEVYDSQTPADRRYWEQPSVGDGTMTSPYHRPHGNVRNGRVVILPLSLLEELAALQVAVASPQAAIRQGLLGQYIKLDMIIETRLHHTIVQRKLTPQLPLLTPRMERAVTEAFHKYLPECEDRTEFQPLQALDAILAIAFNLTENLLRTVIMLRSLPAWMHPLVYPFLPSYWESRKYVDSAKHLLRPKLREFIEKSDAGTWEPKDNSADDLNILSWLGSTAKARDRDPDAVAHILVIVTLATEHTTFLREIAAVAEGGWSVSAYDQLHRLDSVLRESQRLSPPTSLGMKRRFQAPHTFHDGTHVPAGTYVCLPIQAIENDAAHTPGPQVFDGLGSFRALQQLKLSSSSRRPRERPSVGYGKAACPGRVFASVVDKMVIVKLLTEYDFEVLPGTEKPENMIAHEFLFPRPGQKMLVRRRREGVCPF